MRDLRQLRLGGWGRLEKYLADRQIDYDFSPADVFTQRKRYGTVFGRELEVNGNRYPCLIVPAGFLAEQTGQPNEVERERSTQPDPVRTYLGLGPKKVTSSTGLRGDVLLEIESKGNCEEDIFSRQRTVERGIKDPFAEMMDVGQAKPVTLPHDAMIAVIGVDIALRSILPVGASLFVQFIAFFFINCQKYAQLFHHVKLRRPPAVKKRPPG